MDDYPQKICLTCVESIKSIVKFLNKCEKSREDLENQLDPLRNPPETALIGFENVEFLEDDHSTTEDKIYIESVEEVSYASVMDMEESEIKKEEEMTIDEETNDEVYPLLDGNYESDDEDGSGLEEGVSEIEEDGSEIEEDDKSEDFDSDYEETKEDMKKKNVKKSPKKSKTAKTSGNENQILKKDEPSTSTVLPADEGDEEDVQYEESPNDLVCNICGRRYKKQVSDFLTYFLRIYYEDASRYSSFIIIFKIK